MNIPPQQNPSVGKWGVIFAVVFLAIGITAYELIAPSIFKASGASGFSATETIGAGVVGAFCVWLGLKVGRVFDQRGA